MAKAYTIQEGMEYVYTGEFPENCKGHIYKVRKVNVPMVPTYNKLISVECLCGPDKGLEFVVTPWNFSLRYSFKSNCKERCRCEEL